LYNTEPTTRAVLGDKTTNAKARTVRTGGVKNIVREIERTRLKPPATNRVKKAAPQVEPAKLEIHADRPPSINEEDEIEYAPPPVSEIPYESDIIKVDELDLSGIRPENRLKGSYEYYYDPRDDEGIPLRVKKEEAEREKSWKDAMEATYEDIENMEFNIGFPIPRKSDRKEALPAATKPMLAVSNGRLGTKPPGTVAARKAVSALSVAPKSAGRSAFGQSVVKPVQTKSFALTTPSSRPVATRTTSSERATAVIASRSTLGYSKGRNAQSVVQGRGGVPSRPNGLKRSVSVASTGSNATIRPAKQQQGQSTMGSQDDGLRQLDFLSIFDVDEDDNPFGLSDDVLLGDDLDDAVEVKFDIE
jgi:hypothetical protein